MSAAQAKKLAATRARIETLVGEAADLEVAPRSREDAVEEIRRFVDGRAGVALDFAARFTHRHDTPSVLPAAIPEGARHDPERSLVADAGLALVVQLGRDGAIERLVALLDESGVPFGPGAEERRRRGAEIRREVFELELTEERQVRALRAAGVHAPRRRTLEHPIVLVLRDGFGTGDRVEADPDAEIAA